MLMHLHGKIPQLEECTIKEDWHQQSTVGVVAAANHNIIEEVSNAENNSCHERQI